MNKLRKTAGCLPPDLAGQGDTAPKAGSPAHSTRRLPIRVGGRHGSAQTHPEIRNIKYRSSVRGFLPILPSPRPEHAAAHGGVPSAAGGPLRPCRWPSRRTGGSEASVRCPRPPCCHLRAGGAAQLPGAGESEAGPEGSPPILHIQPQRAPLPRSRGGGGRGPPALMATLEGAFPVKC